MPVVPKTLPYSRAGEDQLVAELGARLEKGQRLQYLALGGDSALRGHLAQRLAVARGLGFVSFKLSQLPSDSRRGIASLSRLFSFASSHAVVLFFDEADALFGKRSKVTDSGSRYANYLLAKLRRMGGGVVFGLAESPAPLLAKAVPLSVSLGRAKGGDKGLPRPKPAVALAGLLPSHRFGVSIHGQEVGFCQISGLSVEGGPLSGAGFDSRRADPLKGKLNESELALWPTLTLRRALESDPKHARLLYDWRRTVLLGKPDLRDIEISQFDESGLTVVHRWRLRGCWPKRWGGPDLNALEAGVSCEKIELYYRDLEWR